MRVRAMFGRSGIASPGSFGLRHDKTGIFQFAFQCVWIWNGWIYLNFVNLSGFIESSLRFLRAFRWSGRFICGGGQRDGVRAWWSGVAICVNRLAGTDNVLAKGHGDAVLVVEDNPAVMRVIAELLARSNYRVLQAADGGAAVEIVSGGHPVGLVLSDVFLGGGMSGVALGRTLRKADPGVAIILMSGFAHDLPLSEIAQEFILLRKPFKHAELISAVASALAGGTSSLRDIDDLQHGAKLD